ncbi:hypothetical protein RJ641_025476 [Dillenia turbinata]|uniref:Replication termination factor 2 n=1 Tax=Dillenia turbinata TaxID=194707 RepID=A0AAN8W6Z2_9MAGN
MARKQIFVQLPDLQIPAQTLTLNTNTTTLNQLKLSIISLFSPLSSSQSLTLTLNSVFFTFNGKTLTDPSSLSQIPPLSTLYLRLRLLGGGGDGGATGAESRDCYLNMYAVKKPDKVDPNEQRLSRWTTCALSFEPLKHPCVIDKLGNVFNKEKLVEALLEKKMPKGFDHIKGLKDMIAIELSPIPGLKFDDDTSFMTRFQCPISGLEFNGKYKFFALKSCGHVLSAKALKEVKLSECLVCHRAFLESDKIVINGSEEEVALLRERMEEEKAKLKGKKARKTKTGEVGDVGVVGSGKLSGTKRGVDVNEGEKATAKVESNGKVVIDAAAKGASNVQVKKFKATDAAPPNATKEVVEAYEVTNLSFTSVGFGMLGLQADESFRNRCKSCGFSAVEYEEWMNRVPLAVGVDSLLLQQRNSNSQLLPPDYAACACAILSLITLAFKEDMSYRDGLKPDSS